MRLRGAPRPPGSTLLCDPKRPRYSAGCSGGAGTFSGRSCPPSCGKPAPSLTGRAQETVLPLTPGTPPLARSDACCGVEAAVGGCQSLLAACRAPDPAQHLPAGLPDAAAILCLREGGEQRTKAPGGHRPPPALQQGACAFCSAAAARAAHARCDRRAAVRMGGQVRARPLGPLAGALLVGASCGARWRTVCGQTLDRRPSSSPRD